MAKRPLRQDVAACIAFWRIATPKTGHLLPESLQRFWGGFRAGSCGVWFQRFLAAYRALVSIALRAICSLPALQMSHFCPTFVPDLYRFCTGFVPLSASRCSSPPRTVPPLTT